VAYIPEKFTYGYADLARLCGTTVNNVQQRKCRGELEPDNLRSVLLFLARHGRISLRRQLIDAMLGHERKRPGRRKNNG
jgi:hypothetical protein